MEFLPAIFIRTLGNGEVRRVPSVCTPRTDLLEPPSFTDVDSSSEATYAPSTISSILSNSVSVYIPNLPFPDYPIQDPEGSGLFKTLAMRVTKWRMLARYLGLPDDSIATICQANHFDNERCYKMMLLWSEKSNELATYLKLANSLRNIMRDDLLTEVTCYLPEDGREQPGENVVIGLNSSIGKANSNTTMREEGTN